MQCSVSALFAHIPEGLLCSIPNYAKLQGMTPTGLPPHSDATPATTPIYISSSSEDSLDNTQRAGLKRPDLDLIVTVVNADDPLPGDKVEDVEELPF